MNGKVLKLTFYPKGRVVRFVEQIEDKNRNARINELILKGVEKEREEAVAQEYERYAKEIGLLEDDKSREEDKTFNTMSIDKLFSENEDETEDWF